MLPLTNQERNNTLMSIGHTISRKVRDFLFAAVNGEFLIFLFFFALAGVFWLLMSLNETLEREIKVPVRLVNVPDNVVLMSNETDTVKLTLRDKGLVLAGYVYGDGLKPINLNFKAYVKDSAGYVALPMAEINRLLYLQLSASTKIVQTKGDKYEIYYNYGLSKKVPVKWKGTVEPEHLYFISNVDYSPDSVTVYASAKLLDTITEAHTEDLSISNFRDTLTVGTRITKMRGVKFIPEKVNVRFMTDVLTEESIHDIPIEGINVPNGKVLRTFPAKVNVRFVTGVSQFRKLTKEDFKVVADYDEIADGKKEKCTVLLRLVPHGVSRATLNVQQVDYLIEED